jgi:homogentisate 1,2-dioxygenase
MENFKASGTYTKQAHVKIPAGLYEEEHGRKGFFGRVSHLYHENPLTNWTNIEGELKPRNLPPLFELPELQNNFQTILFNNDVTISMNKLTQSFKHFYRNADFDEMFFIHDGEGTIETSYGHLTYKRGDYIIIPRGTTYKFYIKSVTKILKAEASSEFEQPSRGILGPNALYDQTAIRTPEAATGTEKASEYTIEIKREGQITRVTYPYNPLDVKRLEGLGLSMDRFNI